MRIPHAARPPSGLLPPPAATAAEGVALSDLEDEDAGGRRSRSRRGGGGGRVSRQGSGAASRLQRNAACVKARHNVITAFNPVTQVGSGRACLFSAGQGSGCPAPPRQTSGAAQSHKFLEADAPPLHPSLFAAGAGAPQGEDGGCWRGEGGAVPSPGAACTSPCLLGPHRAAVRARPPARPAPDGRWVCQCLGLVGGWLAADRGRPGLRGSYWPANARMHAHTRMPNPALSNALATAVPVPPALLRSMQEGGGDGKSSGMTIASMEACSYCEVESMAAADWGALSGSSEGHQAVLINPGWECEGRGDAAVQARQGRGRVAAGGGAGWCDFALSPELLPQPAPLPGLWACSLGTCLYPHSPPSAPLPPSLPPAAPGQAAHAAPGAPRLCLHLCGEAARAGAVQTGARNSWSGCAANYTTAKPSF